MITNTASTHTTQTSTPILKAHYTPQTFRLSVAMSETMSERRAYQLLRYSVQVLHDPSVSDADGMTIFKDMSTFFASQEKESQADAIIMGEHPNPLTGKQHLIHYGTYQILQLLLEESNRTHSSVFGASSLFNKGNRLQEALWDTLFLLFDAITLTTELHPLLKLTQGLITAITEGTLSKWLKRHRFLNPFRSEGTLPTSYKNIIATVRSLESLLSVTQTPLRPSFAEAPEIKAEEDSSLIDERTVEVSDTWAISSRVATPSALHARSSSSEDSDSSPDTP